MSLAITRDIIILVFILIIVIALMAAIIVNPKNYSISRWYVFIGTFAAMSLIMTVIFYYSLVTNQECQNSLTHIQETKNVSVTVLDVNIEEMRKCSEVIPNFAASLMPLTLQGVEIGEDDERYVIHEISLSYKIFHAWETAIISKDFLGKKKLSYITNFLQWCSSRKLYERWKQMKVNFLPSTIRLGDLLFEHVEDICECTPEEYARVAKETLVHCRKIFS